MSSKITEDDECRHEIRKHFLLGSDVTNRFRGLDLIDRAPEELWTEVCDIVLKEETDKAGLHLRPVHADHAQPPLQWTLDSVLSAYGNYNRRIRPPLDRGILKITSRLLIA